MLNPYEQFLDNNDLEIDHVEEIVPIIEDTPILRFKKDKLINAFKNVDFLRYLNKKLAEQESYSESVNQTKTQIQNQVTDSSAKINNKKRKNQEPDLIQSKKLT